MSKTLQKHIWREIRGTMGRFVAIFAITALGAGFFAGLRATAPDMRATADSYFEEKNLADYRLLSTYGFTGDDVQALLAREDVADVMPTYAMDLLVEAEDGVAAARLHALPADISADNPRYMNQIALTEGRMPEAADECVADSESHWKIGDVVRLSADNDEDSLDLMASRAFTVVGLAESSYYVSFVRGNTNIASGTLDDFLYLSPEAFDSEYYLELLVTAAGMEGVSAFSDEYEAATGRTVELLEDFGEERAALRYNEIVAEAREELDDGWREYYENYDEVQQELDDALEELEDAERQLADAKQELEDGRRELADGRREYADGLAQYNDGIAGLADARGALQDAERQVAEGEQAFYDGKAVLEQNELEYADGLAKYNNGVAQYEAGLAEYQAGRAEYDAGLAQYNTGLAQYQAGLAQLEQGAAQLAGLQAASDGLSALAGQMAALQDAATAGDANAIAGFNALAGTAADTLRGLAAGLEAGGMASEAAGLYTAADSVVGLAAAGQYAYATGIVTGVPGQLAPSLASAQAELDQNRAYLATVQAQLAAAKAELDATLPQLTAAEQTLAQNKQLLDETGVQLDDARRQLNEGWAELEAGTGPLDSARNEISSGWAGLYAGEAQLAGVEDELADAQKTIADGEKELLDGEAELAEAEQELADGWQEYYDGVAEADKEFADALAELTDAEKELADLEAPEWYVYDRGGNPGYTGFASNADRIGAISSMLPYFFFLVAVLVCLTTMTRMVEEQRTGIGTLKALGYGKGSIAVKFLLYAGFASFVGSAAGVAAGYFLFPYVIWEAYRMMYIMPGIVFQMQPLLLVQSVASMTLVTMAATLASCLGVLRSVPSELMRPKAPKNGTRVLLERVPFIWNKLKFSYKVTIRNLFRYKKRFFMTVIGVAGCTALLVTGFGLGDSISGLVDKQYGDVEHYDVLLQLSNAGSLAEDNEVNRMLDEMGEAIYVQQFAIEAESASANNSELTTYLYVAEQPERLRQFISFNDVRQGGEVEYPQGEGVVVSEKLATRLDLEVGDSLAVNKANETPAEVTVAGVMENYVYHYVYMPPETYQLVTGEAPEYDRVLLRLDADSGLQPNEALESLMALDGVAGGVDVAAMRTEFDDMMAALDSVVWLIIVCAGLLAFVVLYNLTNINITERQREIATLKVLGFYEKEVASYVYRENVALTCIGTLVGLVLGIFLHRYIVVTAEVDEVMFGRVISLGSYLLSVVFTLLSAVVVNLVMLRKLKKIDMVESLKSAE